MTKIITPGQKQIKIQELTFQEFAEFLVLPPGIRNFYVL